MLCYRCAPNYDFGVIIYVPSPLCPSGGISRRGHTVYPGPFQPHTHSGIHRPLVLPPRTWSPCTSYDYRATNRARSRGYGPVSIPQFTSPPLGPEIHGRGPTRLGESAWRWRRDRSPSIGPCEGGRRWPGGAEQEEDCWRMSGHRVSWPGGADGHETNVIGEPSRLLPVARSAFLPFPLPPRPPVGPYHDLGHDVTVDSSSMIFQIRGNCPVASLEKQR